MAQQNRGSGPKDSLTIFYGVDSRTFNSLNNLRMLRHGNTYSPNVDPLKTMAQFLDQVTGGVYKVPTGKKLIVTGVLNPRNPAAIGYADNAVGLDYQNVADLVNPVYPMGNSDNRGFLNFEIPAGKYPFVVCVGNDYFEMTPVVCFEEDV